VTVRYRIDTDAASFTVRFRPGMPGVGARVSGVQGSFDATMDADGRVDLSAPVGGSFTLHIDELQMGNRVLTAATRRWLAGDDEVAVQGAIDDVRPAGDGTYQMALAMTMRHHTYHLSANGSLRATVGDNLAVTGTTEVHPSEVGVPIPRFLPPTVVVAWDLLLLTDG